MELAILFLSLVFLLGIGFPLPFSMGTAAVLGLLAMNEGIPLTVVAQRFVAGIDSFAFMAIPFFLLVGELMNAAGITQRIIRFSNALVGHLPGGLGQVNVVASMFFGGISGSATADTSSIGSIMIPAMVKEGYDKDFSVVLTASSSICGPIIPPSILLVLYGVIANCSITSLFLAGYTPGLMIGVSLMLVTYFISNRKGYPVYAKASARELLAAFKSASFAVFLPFLIIGGMLSGIFTVTEAAGVAVVYAMIVGLFIYGDLKFNEIPQVLSRAMIKIGALMTVAASALIFAWVLTIMEVPQRMTEAIFMVTDNPLMILLLLNVLFLVIGMFMEAKAAMLILLPVILPVIPEVGINIIHFGLVIVFNLCIGLVTPPIGLCLNLGAKIGDVSIDKAARASIPFLAVMIVTLLLITYFPGMVMWLPEMMK